PLGRPLDLELLRQGAAIRVPDPGRVAVDPADLGVPVREAYGHDAAIADGVLDRLGGVGGVHRVLPSARMAAAASSAPISWRASRPQAAPRGSAPPAAPRRGR